jgi:4-hydroxy-3-polyprenylbenzoate decarboxylase
MRLVLCVRETPLSTIAHENMAKLSREGVVIMPLSLPYYRGTRDLDVLVAGFTNKVLALLGEPAGEGWREDELE